VTPPGKTVKRRRRPRQQSPATPIDLWRPVPQLPAAEPITPVLDPTALLRSLGRPPLLGHSETAEHYFAALIERAAALATALAASAGLLAQTEDETGDERDPAVARRFAVERRSD